MRGPTTDFLEARSVIAVPARQKPGDMICTGCDSVLGIVGNDMETLLALVQYISGVRRGNHEAVFFCLWIVASVLWISLVGWARRKETFQASFANKCWASV